MTTKLVTFDAVAGAVSARRAIGSAFARRTPSLHRISNLYAVPSRTSGTNSSHTPDSPSVRMPWPTPSQWLKSPTTRTALALGAQTANAVPVTSPLMLG